MMTLREKYAKEVLPRMMAAFKYKSPMAVPRIEKVVVNVGVGRIRDEKAHAAIQKALSLITGQKAAPRPAKTAISAFKTRRGLIIGYAVTLRGRRMYDFLARLIHVALPRQRDFQGIPEKSFDGRGNLTIGIKEHIVFPEMIGEDYHSLFGLEVTVVTTAKKREEGIELLRLMGFPIRT
jgi:large subunit ribosomal protein L5